MSPLVPILKLFESETPISNKRSGQRGSCLSLSSPLSLALSSKTKHEKCTYFLPCHFQEQLLLLFYMLTLEYMLPVGRVLAYLGHYDILRHKVGLNEYLLHE